MSNLLNGAGVYKRDVEEPPYKLNKKFVELPPKDVRGIVIDGETYVNVNDIAYVMKRMSHLLMFSTLSVGFFIKTFIHNLTRPEDL